jgi:hypothetical protein
LSRKGATTRKAVSIEHQHCRARRRRRVTYRRLAMLDFCLFYDLPAVLFRIDLPRDGVRR